MNTRGRVSQIHLIIIVKIYLKIIGRNQLFQGKLFKFSKV